MRWLVVVLASLAALAPLSVVAQEEEGEGQAAPAGDAPAGEPAPEAPAGDPPPEAPAGDPAPAGEPAPADEPAPATEAPPAGECPTYEDCEARIQNALREALNPENLETAIQQAASEADPAEEAQPEEAPATAEFQAEAPKDPPKPRKGQSADIVKQVTSSEPVKSVLKKLETTVLAKVKADWSKLKIGEQVTVLAVAAPIVAGLAAVPQFSRPIQSFINTEVNKFLKPRVPWLTLRADFVSPNKVLEFRLDVGQILKKAGINLF